MVATALTTVGDVALVALALAEAAALHMSVNARTADRRRIARWTAVLVLLAAIALLMP